MKGLADYLTEHSWEDTIIATFVFVRKLDGGWAFVGAGGRRLSTMAA